MRLYLSSFRLGTNPTALLDLLQGETRAALIANADDDKEPVDRASSLKRELDDLLSLGLDPFELDLRDYFDRPVTDLAGRMSEAALIWIRGGNTFVLRRALRQSGAEILIRELLRDDAVVYGGYSAGGVVLTPSLRGCELVDDPLAVPERYSVDVIWEGLGILDVAFVPHYRSDHPESQATDRVIEFLVRDHRPFIALRDGEALVVDGPNRLVVS